jgi:hypothetical protein
MKLNIILLNLFIIKFGFYVSNFLFMCQGFTRLFENIIEFATEVKKKNYYNWSSGDYIVAG